jgi:hypothetical protein
VLASGVELHCRDSRAVRIEQGGVLGLAPDPRRRLPLGDHPLLGEPHFPRQLAMPRLWRGLDIEPDLAAIDALIKDQAPNGAPQQLPRLDQVRLHAQFGDQVEGGSFGAVAPEVAPQPVGSLERVE